MLSRIIKKTIAEEEEIKKHFSICGKYINIKIIIAFFKYLFIFLVIGFISFLIGSYSIIEEEKINEFFLLLGLIFVLVVVPIIFIYNKFYLRISNEFVFTNKRILVKRGWLNTNIKTIYYNRITDVSVSQSLLEKIIKTGTISISTAGSDGYEAVLWHINDPHKLKRELYNIKNAYQEQLFQSNPQKAYVEIIDE